MVNPFPYMTILQQTTEHIWSNNSKSLKLNGKVENIVAKGDIARLMFKVVCCRIAVWERVNPFPHLDASFGNNVVIDKDAHNEHLSHFATFFSSNNYSIISIF